MMRRRNLFTPSDNNEYITNGLVLWLDGINRGGVAGEWHNLAGNHIVTLSGDYAELTKGINFIQDNTPYGLGLFDSKTGLTIAQDQGTIEICVELTAVESAGRPTLTMGNQMMGGSIASSGSTPGPIMRWYNRTSSMNAYKFSENSLNNNLKITASGNTNRALLNGYDGEIASISSFSPANNNGYIASRGTGNPFKGIMYSIRLYNKL